MIITNHTIIDPKVPFPDLIFGLKIELRNPCAENAWNSLAIGRGQTPRAVAKLPTVPVTWWLFYRTFWSSICPNDINSQTNFKFFEWRKMISIQISQWIVERFQPRCRFWHKRPFGCSPAAVACIHTQWPQCRSEAWQLWEHHCLLQFANPRCS